MSTLSRNVTTLSVSWLNNQFHAVSVRREKAVSSATREGSFEGVENLSVLIQELLQETGYEGDTISLVLTHPRLAQQIIDVPAVKGVALEKVIRRQAQQQSLFPGEAAYASQFLAPSKGSPRALLHLFPRVALNQFMLACKRNGLTLVSVLPASVVLQRQLFALSLQRSDIVALAAETSGTTTVIVADGDGRLLLARTLQGSWNDDAPRLALDLHRTLLYVTQQFGVTINRGLYLFGPGAAEQGPRIQNEIKFPVHTSPVVWDPSYWATESLKVRQETAPNFLSPELQKAPQRRVFAKVVAACVALLLLGSISLTAYALIQSRREQATIDTISKQLAQTQARTRELQLVDTELQRKQQAIRLVLGEKPPPTPAWLLAYLGQTIPADLVVTNFSVKREFDYYRVKIVGTPQRAELPAKATAQSIADLKAQLAGKPFHMLIVGASNSQPAAVARSGSKLAAAAVPLSDWLHRLAETKSEAAKRDAERRAKMEEINQFTIEGALQ